MTDTRDDPEADREWLVNQIAHALRNPIFAATVQTEALHFRINDPQAVIKTADALHGQLQRLSTEHRRDAALRPARSARRSSGSRSPSSWPRWSIRYSNGDRQEPAEMCRRRDRSRASPDTGTATP